MNKNIIHNTAYNYLSDYRLSMEHLDEIQKLVVANIKMKFCLCKRLCKLAPNSRVTEESCSFIVEIDAEEKENQVDNIGKKFLIKIIKRTRPDKKKSCYTEVGNLFLKMKVFK